MSQIRNSQNPFLRGYDNLHVVRTLLITFKEAPPVRRPLHPDQASLTDEQIALSACRFGQDFAWVADGSDVPDALAGTCPNSGFVRTVTYAVIGEETDGQPVHVGDLYSEEVARETVRRLSFETGFYSRAWEISGTHLSEETQRYLTDLARSEIPHGLLFVPFLIPYCPAVGIKLIATPWTDEFLMSMEGIAAGELWDEFRQKGVPDDLVYVLERAAQADVRLLIFDDDAPVLEGLPVVAT